MVTTFPQSTVMQIESYTLNNKAPVSRALSCLNLRPRTMEMTSRTFFILLLGLLACFSLQTKAANSSEPSLKEVQNALIRKVQQRKVFGNALDPIAIGELPGYTGWPRNRIDSKVDECFVTRIDGDHAIVTLDSSLNIFHLQISHSMSVMWNISIACPNVTVSAEKAHLHLPSPLFYARAYGPAILVGYPQMLTGIVHQGQPYSQTQISFAVKDPGVYTIEVVLESIFSPNFDVWDSKSHGLYYEGFLLHGFPLILNVTSNDILCNTALSCNYTFCRGKDIESDKTSMSGRWIVLGHSTQNASINSEKQGKDDIYQKYVEGHHRLSIVTDYKPINCVLAPLHSSVALMDTCVLKTGIHYVFIGDSVTGQHFSLLKHLLNERNRMTMVSVGFPELTRMNSTEKLLQIKHNSTQPIVIVFNAGLHEVYCERFFYGQNWLTGVYNLSADFNASTLASNCMELYRYNFKRLLVSITQTFPSELKIFRTTGAAWVRWGNFGFSWPPGILQFMYDSPHLARRLNDIALEVINESGYGVKVYDLFWMSWSRPDNTEIQHNNDIGGHIVHVGRDPLKVSIRKLLTIVADHFGCWT